MDRVQEDRGGGPTASNFLGRQQSSPQGQVDQQSYQMAEAATSRTSVGVRISLSHLNVVGSIYSFPQ